MISDGETNRRLKPVLEALYSGHYKKAVKKAAMAEAKRPGWVAARALRAVALDRAGESEEAAKLISRIRTEIAENKVKIYDADATNLEVSGKRNKEGFMNVSWRKLFL